MFKEMRRSDRQLSKEEALQILEKAEYGILSTIGEDGYPYGVPVSFAYKEGIIYFHGANGVGHKVENMKQHDKVCFTAVGDTQVLPGQFVTRYESVIAFGRVYPVTDKLTALELISKKYSPDYEEQGKKYAVSSQEKVGVYAIYIEHLSGKARKK